MTDIDAYRAKVRLIVVDKQGGEDEIDTVMDHPFVDTVMDHPFVDAMIESLLGAGAHEGYTAETVRKWMATRCDLAIAERHRDERSGS